MGAPKARHVKAVNTDTGTVEIEIYPGTYEWVEATDLKRTELIRAVKVLHPRANGKTVATTAENSLMIDVLLGDSLPDEWCEQAPHSEPKAAPKAAVPTVPNGAGDPAQALAQAIQGIAAGAVNVETVEKIVAEQVAEALKHVRPTVVQLPDLEPVEIKGRTHAMFERVLLRAHCRRNIYLTGTPGTGKTTLAEQVADALELDFSTLSLSPQTSTSRLFGYKDANGSYQRTAFRDRYEHGGVFLFDELDNGHPATVAEVNQAIANGHADFPDGRVAKHGEFVAIAAANTFGNGPTAEFSGRFPLDKATLDRFVMIPIPIDEDLERQLANDIAGIDGDQWCDEVQACRKNVEKHGLKVFVTPRATIDGSYLIKAGAKRDEIRQECLRKGATDDQWRKIAA